MLKYTVKRRCIMKVIDAFEEVFTGFNMNNATSSEKSTDEAYFIQKDSIQYTNIISEKY